jgi:hypothetical protein
MSQENVERYRQGIDAFNRRDLDAFLALADPGVVGVSRVPAIQGGTWEGHDGTREWWNDGKLRCPPARDVFARRSGAVSGRAS